MSIFSKIYGLVLGTNPATPSANRRVLFAKSDGWYDKDSAGVVSKFQTGANTAPYLVYTALLTQSGTDDPIVTVLENTLGGTVVWTYVDVGTYLGTLTGAFAGDVICAPSLGIDQNGYGLSSPYSVYKDSDDAIGVSTFSDYSGTVANDRLNGTAYIEIKVYYP